MLTVLRGCSGKCRSPSQSQCFKVARHWNLPQEWLIPKKKREEKHSPNHSSSGGCIQQRKRQFLRKQVLSGWDDAKRIPKALSVLGSS